MSTPTVTLYATPPLSPLPASDAESLYLLSLLRLSRLEFTLRTGDYGWSTSAIAQSGSASENGKLPYLTHLDSVIRERYLSSLPGYEDPDGSLSIEERAESTAWVAYINAKLVDLVNHSLYVLPENYKILAAAQRSGLAFPQSYYVPQRIRSIVGARLEHVGLWGLGHAEDVPVEQVTGPAGTSAPVVYSWKAGKLAADRARKWGQEEVLKKAREVLDPLARRLGRGRFFFRDRPTTLDIALLAQLTLILTPDLPNPILSNLIRETYPSLASHHDRTLTVLFPAGWSFSPRPAVPSNQPRTWASVVVALGKEIGQGLLPRNLWESVDGDAADGERTGGVGEQKKKKKMSEKEKRFQRARWLWFVGAGVTMVTYLLASGIVSIQFGGEDEEPEEEEEEDEEEEEEEDEMVEVVDLIEAEESEAKASGLPVWEDDEERDSEE